MDALEPVTSIQPGIYRVCPAFYTHGNSAM
jgi:hypothetical protein